MSKMQGKVGLEMKCPDCNKEGSKSDWAIYDYYCKNCKRYFRKP